MRKTFSLIAWEISVRSHMSWKMISLYEKLSFFSLYLASFVYNLARVDNSRSKSLSLLIESGLIDWFEDFFDWSMCEESECSLNEKDLLNDDSMYADWFSRDSLNVEQCSLNWWWSLNEMRWLYETDLDDESDFLEIFRKRDFSVASCLIRKIDFSDARFRFFRDVYLRNSWSSDW